MKKVITPSNAPTEDIRGAYEKLAEGVCAVLALESTDASTHDLLTGMVSEIWNTSANEDAIGSARWHLLHAGEWKARSAEEG